MNDKDAEKNIQIDDAMAAKKNQNTKKAFKTILLVIVLVLIADMCILLGLNKLGVVDINDKIKSIPVVNNFTNEKVILEKEETEIDNLTLETDSLKKQLQLAQADLSAATAEVEVLKKENKLLEEELLKIQNQKEETNKMTIYYSKMKPKQAAQAFNNLDAQICADILEGMSESTAATILDKMDSNKVVEVTKIYNPTKKQNLEEESNT